MVEMEVCGEIIWRCTQTEASQLWKQKPDDRHRIWSEEEVQAHMLATPEEVAELLARKKAKPGRLE